MYFFSFQFQSVISFFTKDGQFNLETIVPTKEIETFCDFAGDTIIDDKDAFIQRCMFGNI